MHFMTMTRCIPAFLLAWLLLAVLPAAGADETVTVFESAPIDYDKTTEQPLDREGLTVLGFGQIVQRQVLLPARPDNQRDARRIVARVEIEPVPIEKDGKLRPGDPWTRIGSVSISREANGPVQAGEAEVMRFITGFGGPGVFEQDVTSLAPLLAGPTTVRLFISTYMNPGWRATLTFTYSEQGVGFRRPAFARPLFTEPFVTAEQPRLTATISVPPDLAQPRLRVISTGHATDGRGGDEFVTRRHVLRIDDRQVVAWRPWAEAGGPLRQGNPTSGRVLIDGRQLWSSDLDRSGWNPGDVVHPLIIPLPELTPGRHTIELAIEDIRPRETEEGPHGYWRTSAVVVADEPWPEP